MANFIVKRKSPQELTQKDIDVLVKWTSDEGWETRPIDIRLMYAGPPYLDAKIFFFLFFYFYFLFYYFFFPGLMDCPCLPPPAPDGMCWTLWD